MEAQYDSFLDHPAQELMDMDGSCAASPTGLVFTNWETLDLYHMVHHSPTDDYPQAPLRDDDIACDPYFTTQLPRHFEMGVTLYPTNKTFQETYMNPSANYMLHDSHDSFISCPIPHYSVPEGSVWDLMTPSDGETVWDLSAMDPDIRNISERVQSELFSLWEPPASVAQQRSSESSENEQDPPAVSFAPSLMDAFRYPCSYPGCTKTFKRKEHAKRHYTTKHGNTNRNPLRCEYCGKDTFTRTDNLNAHRRLHARRAPKACSGVYFVPQALEDLRKNKKGRSFNGDKIDITVEVASCTM
ncbi:zinc finger odd-paired-like (opl) [Fusarium tjaetaba]|uniref:Zinc finger odd-paired-like (Opl) n=1 Tax=Fusarium tjaetaba TaxID=1567544 RepID=A0A8H5RTY2_9HYPO|nr:zinc finger odd-paired-like (opl) [Fusarium tjaetaba]KAF5638392.1 zinc finger odd-paired-like (opl) [Fusarium tjaetaba]